MKLIGLIGLLLIGCVSTSAERCERAGGIWWAADGRHGCAGEVSCAALNEQTAFDDVAEARWKTDHCIAVTPS